MFQLVCDPSGVVVETTLKELVPAVVTWGKMLDHVLRVLLSHTLSSAQVGLFESLGYFCSCFSFTYGSPMIFFLCTSALSTTFGS